MQLKPGKLAPKVQANADCGGQVCEQKFAEDTQGLWKVHRPPEGRNGSDQVSQRCLGAPSRGFAHCRGGASFP